MKKTTTSPPAAAAPAKKAARKTAAKKAAAPLAAAPAAEAESATPPAEQSLTPFETAPVPAAKKTARKTAAAAPAKTPAKKAVRKKTATAISPAEAAPPVEMQPALIPLTDSAAGNSPAPAPARKTVRRTTTRKSKDAATAETGETPPAQTGEIPPQAHAAPQLPPPGYPNGPDAPADGDFPSFPHDSGSAADHGPAPAAPGRRPRTAESRTSTLRARVSARPPRGEAPGGGESPTSPGTPPGPAREGRPWAPPPKGPAGPGSAGADAAAAAGGGPLPGQGYAPGHPQGPRSPYPPRHARPWPPRQGEGHGAPPPSGGPVPPPGGPGPQPHGYAPETGPDGEPRRLTKWERWKQRKEKFKQQKQQRYLERIATRNGQPPPQPPGAENLPGDPPGEGAHRPWEPRPPRPEIPLGPPEDCEGLLEMTDKGYAFLRPKDRGYTASPTDPFVSAELVRQNGLREGVWVEAVMRRAGRGPQVTELKKVNGLEPAAYRTLPLFEELTAVNPNKRYILETESKRNTTRLIDFISPIGRGQRGLIVAPPRTGKTTFLQHIAEAVLHNYEDVKVIVLLVDERPEEVTEIARALPGAEIMASSNDQDPRNHIRMASLAIERAKRLVEAGEHVFMLLDSITRLARGFNNAMRGGGGGKAMSGGLDSRALEAPRRLFAAARNTREAGSLTIMATALVETNNKGDDLIFQEFKGTGNMELVLDRKISQQYVYPAVDIFKSGTRREELLLPPHQLEKVHLIRRGLSGHRPQEAVERLLQVMSRYPNNNQMLIEIKARGE